LICWHSAYRHFYTYPITYNSKRCLNIWPDFILYHWLTCELYILWFGLFSTVFIFTVLAQKYCCLKKYSSFQISSHPYHIPCNRSEWMNWGKIPLLQRKVYHKTFVPFVIKNKLKIHDYIFFSALLTKDKHFFLDTILFINVFF